MYVFVVQVAYNVQFIAEFLLIDLLATVYIACTETTTEEDCTKKGIESLSSVILKLLPQTLWGLLEMDSIDYQPVLPANSASILKEYVELYFDKFLTALAGMQMFLFFQHIQTFWKKLWLIPQFVSSLWIDVNLSVDKGQAVSVCIVLKEFWEGKPHWKCLICSYCVISINTLM